MEFYHYRPDANNFAGIAFSLKESDRVVDLHFTDAPQAANWAIPVAHGFEDNPENQGDFPSLSNYSKIPVMSDRAWSVLRPIINCCCEALPVKTPFDKVFWIIHVMRSIDCLDASRSNISRSTVDGRINRVYKYAFKPGLLDQQHIFKLPLESGADLLVDDVFREAVEKHALKGLLFKPLPMAD